MIKNFKQFNESVQNIIDELLDKISKSGIDSLSPNDIKILNEFSISNTSVKNEIERQQLRYKRSKEVLNSIPLRTNNIELERNIGKFVRFKKKNKTAIGLISWMGTIYEIVDVQKHWGYNKELKYVPDIDGYRLARVGVQDDFGKVGSIDDIVFVDISEEDAIIINKKILDELDKRY